MKLSIRDRFVAAWGLLGIFTSAALLTADRVLGWFREDIACLLWPSVILLLRPEGVRLSPGAETAAAVLAIVVNGLVYALAGALISGFIMRDKSSLG